MQKRRSNKKPASTKAPAPQSKKGPIKAQKKVAKASQPRSSKSSRGAGTSKTTRAKKSVTRKKSTRAKKPAASKKARVQRVSAGSKASKASVSKVSKKKTTDGSQAISQAAPQVKRKPKQKPAKSQVSDQKNPSVQTRISAPRGSKKSCKTWQAEAAMRMLMNNLDREVAEDPDNLVIYGGTGQAARNWDCYHAIIKQLRKLKKDETLLVQSGKPVAVFQTQEEAPRVLIANSNLVGKWDNWEHFNQLKERGLIMYGQMTAGSWIYIGSQGILQGTYETLCSAAEIHYGKRKLQGKLFVSGGLGGMGGAQPLAMSMAGGVSLVAEVDPARLQARLDTKYLDKQVQDLDEAIDLALQARAKGKALSIGWQGNAIDLLERLCAKRVTPDLLSDQTSAHDPLNGYVPKGHSLEEAVKLRAQSPKTYLKYSFASMAEHVRLMIKLQERGAHTFDYGNNLRGHALEAGVKNAFDFPGFVPAYIRPQFCKGRGPFRWVALSGDPQDIFTTDQALMKLFPQDRALHRWLTKAQKRVTFQGLPARICWLGYGERDKAGLLFNKLVASKKVKAPIVIGRDHLDCGSVASPYRETEAMQDGSDAIADWPLLNALLNTACGASWVSLHGGGGVGIGYSSHAGQVVVADGSPQAKKQLKRVLRADPGLGVVRHIDAGYEEAKSFNRSMKDKAVNVPMS